MSISKKEYNRNYYIANKDRTRAGRIASATRHYVENRDDERISNNKKEIQERLAHPSFPLWKNAKSRCNKSGLEFSIDLDDIIIPDVCPIMGYVLTKEGKRATSPSLDRIDNTRGYVKGNVRVISVFANSRKGSLTLEEIKKLYEYSLTSS